MKEKLAKLIDVKSIITILLTVIFCFMCVTGKASTDFITIYTMCISFYFGVQSTKRGDKND